MRVAIEGCCHGNLDQIYKAVAKKKIDLLLICGDFQSIRNYADLQSMSVPDKYKKVGDFQKYYTGKEKAPVFTIFIGGNHESSQYLDELKYGGFVAPNIYYMGRSSVVWYKGLRIGGMSGIYYKPNFMKPRPKEFTFPLDKVDLRGIYHYRKEDYFKFRILKESNDMVMLSHDWPEGIYQYGDVAKLIEMKPFFKKDTIEHTLGSPFLMQLVHSLRPKNWFSAHLHVKFTAKINWKDEDQKKRELLDCEQVLQVNKKRKVKEVKNTNEIKLDMSDIENLETDTNEKVTSKKDITTDEIELDMCCEDESSESRALESNTLELEINTHKNEDEIDLSLELTEEDKPKDINGAGPSTKFLSLDKCLAKRKWLEILDIQPTDPDHISNQNRRLPFFHDEEYISSLRVIEKHKRRLDDLTYDQTLNPPSLLLEEFTALKDYYLKEYKELDEERQVDLFSIPIQKSTFKKTASENLKQPQVFSNPQTREFEKKFLCK